MLGVPAAEGRWYASAFVQLLISGPRVVVNSGGQPFRHAEECVAGSGAGFHGREDRGLIGGGAIDEWVLVFLNGVSIQPSDAFEESNSVGIGAVVQEQV